MLTSAVNAKPRTWNIICAVCDRQFLAHAHNRKACVECGPIYNKRRHDGRNRMVAVQSGRVLQGQSLRCPRCGDFYPRDARRVKYCPPCRPLAETDLQIQRNAAYGQRIGRSAVGSLIKCRDCPQEFVTDAPNQIRCQPCRHEARQQWRRDETRRNASCPRKSLNNRMRGRIIKSVGASKAGRPWESLVGFTLADLTAHIEKQFLPGMTWENRGEWHIDHIRPLCSFNFQTPECPQFREAWALTNLQPLWAIDNLKKGGRWKPPTE